MSAQGRGRSSFHQLCIGVRGSEVNLRSARAIESNTRTQGAVPSSSRARCGDSRQDARAEHAARWLCERITRPQWGDSLRNLIFERPPVAKCTLVA
jgi:hypothetical protein